MFAVQFKIFSQQYVVYPREGLAGMVQEVCPVLFKHNDQNFENIVSQVLNTMFLSTILLQKMFCLPTEN